MTVHVSPWVSARAEGIRARSSSVQCVASTSLVEAEERHLRHGVRVAKLRASHS
jgi:hypothetical protein